MSKPITISIVGNAGPLKKSLKESEDALGKFGNTAKKLGIAAAAGLGAAAAGIGVAIGKASDLNETISKAGVIFGDADKEIQKFAKGAAASLGQSRKQALDAAATFGIFGKSAGLAGKDLSDFSIDFTKLASDLASFNNTSPEDAINAIGAALRGESEPLRRYGVLLNDASLKQAALSLGIYDGNGALTAQQKVLAAQKVIFEQTTDAQGDFARTSDGLANSTRILKAQLEDAITTLGQAFLPIAVKIAAFAKDTFIPVIEKLTEAFSKDGLKGVLTLSTDAMLRFYDEASTLTKTVIASTIAISGMYAALKTLTFIQTVTTLVKGLTVAVNAATVSMAGFQTTALGMAKTVGLVFAAVAFSVDQLLADNAFAGKRLMESVAQFANVIIAGIESVFNSAVQWVNLLNKAANALVPGDPFPMLDPVKFGRIREDYGSMGAFPTPTKVAPRLVIPSIEPRTSAPVIPAPVIVPAAGDISGGGGGGGRGSTRAANEARTVIAPTEGFIAAGESAAQIGFAGIDLSGVDFMAQDQRILPDTVNITVNTVSADANLPNLIVDALQQYNLVSGPLDVQIAV